MLKVFEVASTYSPENRLYCAVIYRAIQDLNKREKEKNSRWLFEKRNRDILISLCDIIDLNVDYLLKIMQKAGLFDDIEKTKRASGPRNGSRGNCPAKIAARTF